MGHSHRGTLERLGNVVYANSGSWLDGSHLVVRRDPDSGRLVRVELRAWRNDGVVRTTSMLVPHVTSDETVATDPADDPSTTRGYDAEPFVSH
jgi:hypothetical protein